MKLAMIHNHEVRYYLSSQGDNPVKKFLDSLQISQKAKVFRIFQAYQAYGLSSIIPHTKKLHNTPLWEIRVLGKDSIRVLYAVQTKHAIVVLHGFIKKSQKTPPKELAIALERHRDWIARS